MAATTWTVGGTALTSIASEVVQIGSDNLPKLRGSDRTFALRYGAAHRNRITDSRTITLGLTIRGTDEPSATTSSAWRNAFELRWRTLERLLRPEGGRQFSIAKAWTDDLGAHTATGYGIVEDSIERVMAGPYRARVTFSVFMADPFFYEAGTTQALALSTPVTIANAGDDTCHAITITLTGPLTNPKVTNATYDPDLWVKAGATVASLDSYALNCDQQTAVRSSDSANMIGTITHSGAAPWMLLKRGNNSLTLTADSGSGSASITYQPVWY